MLTGTALTGAVAAATGSSAGTMSAGDKTKLDGLPAVVPIPTLQQVTDAGATTTDSVTVGGVSTNGLVSASSVFIGGNQSGYVLQSHSNSDLYSFYADSDGVHLYTPGSGTILRMGRDGNALVQGLNVNGSVNCSQTIFAEGLVCTDVSVGSNLNANNFNCNNMTIQGDDGNLYQLRIATDGTLYTQGPI